MVVAVGSRLYLGLDAADSRGGSDLGGRERAIPRHQMCLPFLIQLGLFVTPVIYPTSFVPRRFQTLVALNPLSGIVEGFRACLFAGSRLDPMLTVVSLTGSALVCIAGVVYFRRAERRFADIIRRRAVF
jgi:ABC-type polysaccharide/polyol phosphate export permease